MEKIRVLVVDDEPAIVEMICRELTKEGYETVGTGDAIEALKVIEEPFAVIIVDLRMPKMDGLDLIRTIGEKYPQTQVIIITGHGDEKDAIEAVKLHVFDYIRKGELAIDKLLESIEKAAARYKALPKLSSSLEPLSNWVKTDETVENIRKITSDIEGSLGDSISETRG